MKIKTSIKMYLKEKINNKHYIQNLNYDIENDKQKKVLICYLDYQVLQELNYVNHTQIYEFSIIVKYFIEKEYCIDICPYNYDYQNEIKHNYDVIIGLGSTFRTAVQNNPFAQKILYLTENPPHISEQLEKERIEYYYERKKIKVSIERSGICYIKSDFIISDYLIYMCGKHLINKENSYFIYPTGLKRQDFQLDYKIKNKKAFIWFGGPAAIHKGLDICIDVFEKHKDWELYVAGVTKSKLKTYRIKDSLPNIHIMGFLNINSEEYINVINKSVFVLLPSCSEAVSTSVLTSMRHGLIPIVCQNNGFEELKDLVFILKDYHVDYVDNMLSSLVEKYTLSDLEKMSRKIMEFADTEFTSKSYKNNLYRILDRIIYQNPKG